MIKWIFTSLLFIGLSLCSPAVFGQSHSFSKLCKKYFKITGSEENFKAVIRNMISTYKQEESMSIVPADVWDDMEKEMIKELDNYYDKIIVVYSQHFTEEDLKAVIEFYETPAGKKLVKETPEILQESMNIGREWGREIGEKIGDKLRRKGYLNKT